MDNNISVDLKEKVIHGTRDLPFVIYKNYFSNTSSKYVLCHWHNEIEIAFCIEGSIKYIVNDKTFILNKDNFIIVNSNALHQAEIIDGNATWYAILFDPKFLYGFEESKIQTEIFDSISYNNLFLKDKDILNDIYELINIYFSDTDFRSLKILNILSKIYLSILKEAKENDEVKNTNSRSQSVKLKQALDFISINYKNKITIDDISKNVGICRSEVCRLFKTELNISIADYILKYRIEKSIPLLLSNKLNITEIAEECGFNSSSYFAEAFKKIKNTTPLEYKKQNMKN